MQRLLVTILITWFTINCNSQQQDLRFSRISTEEGLSASWVRSIYQDKYGFIWIGTSDGLNRYDGYEMKVYKPDDDQENTLINGGVNHIAERRDGMLWICTTQGVSVLNLDKNIFYPFPYLDKVRVTHVMEDSRGRAWFASYSGIFLYEPADSTLQNFRNDPLEKGSLIFDQADRCFEDQEGRIWIATQKGLDLFMPETSTFEHFNPAQKENTLSGFMVKDIVQDKQNRIWVGLNDAGVDILVKDDQKRLDKIIPQCIDGYANNLLIDRHDRLWIGNSMGMGIQLVDLNNFSVENPEFTGILGESKKKWTLSDNTVSYLYEDKQGGIWVGTYAGGINYYSDYLKPFNVAHQFPGEIEELNDKVINCFLYDSSYFWIGTESGLYRFDPVLKQLSFYDYDPGDETTLGAHGIISLFKDSRGNLWVGTWNGHLNVYNYKLDNFKRVYAEEDSPGKLNNPNIFSIHEDKRGNLWIGTNGGGLNRYDYQTGRFTAYLPEANQPNSLYHNAVNDICETAEGELYVSVYHSVEVFDYETETFRHYYYDPQDSTSISSGRIVDIFEDSRKNIWVGTSTGLNLFNKTEGTFRRYSTKQGLPSNTIQAILEDDHGNIWLSTIDGIAKFVDAIHLPDTARFINYHVTDGLRGNEFVRRSAYKHTDGWLYFGGTKGYTYFNPDRIKLNEIPPEVVFTGFRLFNVSPNEYSHIVDSDINLMQDLKLKYDQCDFIIQYAALNFVDPLQNNYKYILEGYEEDWHEVGRLREATYTNIDPGRYVFKVMGSNNDGIWSTEAKTMRIYITPPWWGTWLFRILVLLAIGLFIYGLFRMRLRLLNIQKRLLEEKVRERTAELSNLNSLMEETQEEITLQNEELSLHRDNLERLVEERTEAMKKAMQRAEEADRLKSAFLANMSHEIRTPMNAIVGFAALLNAEDIEEEERKEFSEIITNNCNALMVLINDILEVSLIEANQIEIQNDPFEVYRVFEELESYFTMNNRKDLKFRFNREISDRKLILRNDSTRFRQIFNNLLTNAYKYTEYGSIEFGYTTVNGNIQFYVKDTGIGIDESEYQNIFNFFHKIDKGRNQFYRGAGIGLSISNKLAELMGGKIWLESEPGVGTTFYVSFNAAPYNTLTQSTLNSDDPQKQEVYDFSQKTIIVAEDESANYFLIEKIVKKTRAKLVWAKNGREAVDYIQEMSNQMDCIVIMDIKMPIMNGIRAADEIGKINPRIPVIAVTAYAQNQNREEILLHNFVDYIAKPLKPELLLESISRQAL